MSASDIYLLTYTRSAPEDAGRALRRQDVGSPSRCPPLPLLRAIPYPDAITTPSSKNVWIATDLVHTGAERLAATEVNASRLLRFDGSKWSWVGRARHGQHLQHRGRRGRGVGPGQRPIGTGTGWDFLRWNGRAMDLGPGTFSGHPGHRRFLRIYSLIHIPGTRSFWAEGNSYYWSPSNQREEPAAVVFKYGSLTATRP